MITDKSMKDENSRFFVTFFTEQEPNPFMDQLDIDVNFTFDRTSIGIYTSIQPSI